MESGGSSVSASKVKVYLRFGSTQNGGGGARGGENFQDGRGNYRNF